MLNLRRSKRNTSSNNGFKTDTPMNPKSRKKQQKTPVKHQQGKQHLPFFSLSDFPDLAEIDKIIASGNKAPALSVDQLQKVAMERCGIQKEKVSTEILLVAKGDNPGNEGESLCIMDH
jgi:hypothetical protein